MSESVFREALDRLNDELGRKAFSPCVEVFLYGNAERKSFQRAVLTGIDAIEARFKGALKWYKTNTMKLPKKTAPASAHDVAENYFESIQAKPPILAGIQFHAGADKEAYEVPAIAFFSENLSGKSGFKSRAYIRLGLPMSEPPASVQELSRKVVKATPLVAGHSGWSFYWSGVDPDEEQLVRANARSWLTRFPGLGFGTPLSFLPLIANDLLSVSWLTYVSREAVEAHDETLESLESRLKKARVSAQRIDDRVLEVQTGPAPSLGDRNRNELLPEYRKVGHALSFMKLGTDKARFIAVPGMDQEARAVWSDRFFDGEE